MNIEQVHGWAEEAGQIALHYFNVAEARIKADRSVVTEADIQIEALLRERIAAAYPDHAIIGEEQGGATIDTEYLWAIDPIDGTSGFVQGLPIWGISIGLLRYGEPVLGCFYLPLVREWYEAGLEGPALFNGQPLHVTSGDLLDDDAWICVPSNIHRRYTIDYPGKVRSLGSVAAYLCYVARGTAAGALLGRAAIWDIAAGLAILRRAGGDMHLLGSGTVVDLSSMLTGRPPAEPLIAGSPAALRLLHKRIRRVR
jgi:fructose-1,6-bisphosphatase/inositol monophosphatase family enzyme